MPTIFHRKDIKFEAREARVPEFQWHTSPRLAKLAGSKHLQFDLRSLDPGKFSFPYHFHRASEDFFMIVSGEATLRTPDGFQRVSDGDIVFFEEGPTGAHQLYNHGKTPCVYLDMRTTSGIDVAEYPDSGKIAILPPIEVFENASRTDYYKGEEDVGKKWPTDIVKNRG